jgi:N12 class adenine-specific DNA methylase
MWQSDDRRAREHQADFFAKLDSEAEGRAVPRALQGRPDEHTRPAARAPRPSKGQPLLPFGPPPDPHRTPVEGPEPGRVDVPPSLPPPPPAECDHEILPHQVEEVASGEVGKAKDVLHAVRTLKRVEAERRLPDGEERRALLRFGGFGALALSIFPDPVSGRYKSATWEQLGDELEELLTPDEYASAKRSVFNAFYTSPAVVKAMFSALRRLGVPEDATVLEPGCGAGNFLRHAPRGMHFIGVELDSVSGRIARALFPAHDVRIEDFGRSKLPRVDAAIGNPPFADLKLEHDGTKYSLHDFFFVKSLDALREGGILAFVTTHFTLDKQNGSVREHLSARADFLGAVRLPSEAFRREGTRVVTDIVFLRKRFADEPENHVDQAWLERDPVMIDGVPVTINRYFVKDPEMVLGTFSREGRLYDATYSVKGRGGLEGELSAAVSRLPELSGQAATTRTRHEASVPFVPPPLGPHITEGSFFVGREDRVVYQVADGKAEPVVYGGATLKANGTMTGTRMASLIRIRDAARLVLQSQNQGWPEGARVEARRELNRHYDLFVSQYGLINKTTFSESKDGTVIQRMPNVVKFIEDPDAMLVLALEECDPTSGLAVKAAIMKRDVVGRAPPITAVKSAEEGLLVSLDQKGEVALPFIASLYGKKEAVIVEELGDLVFEDPQTGRWHTSDDYLSGDVRAKLKAAERAGPEYARNAEALRAVQPEDVLPGEIDANLGAPWVPEKDVRAFAAALFGAAINSIRIAHVKKDALWSVEAGYEAMNSVPTTTDYGTSRANGVTLFEQALNLKVPAIYDVVRTAHGEERVFNAEETLAAREKQKRIKDAFRSWVFSDPERTERLVRTYNDTYNNVRLRQFDGSHLAFPGMSRAIALHQHQKDAIWRCISGGNTLLAHTVGAGKTMCMAASAMKLKQAGLIRKPLFVVPNHMLEQFARECQQLYPNAKYLVATKDDLARDRRKGLVAKVASSEWDGIIVTHSSFERIGMSRAYQEKSIRRAIDDYNSLLVGSAANRDGAHRNIIKALEKMKAKREEKLKDLLAEDKKDDGLVFDELGVDYLFIDEAHYFKNLETPTKMERVAGIQTSGSERAFDLYMKCRYLDEEHRGHGVCFATGTPISNSLMEMYTMQRFLDPKGLEDRGIEHFDGWAACFGEVVEAMEISPDGKTLRPRSRFARFVNLPELQQMFRSFADVQTAAMLNLPTPALAGGKAAVVPCPMSEEQHTIQRTLVARYERLRSSKVDPREDNALAITTDGRKLALDARLVSPAAAESFEGKVNALVERVVRTYRASEETKGTQLVFCDLGVNETPWGYSVYRELVSKLASSGIPRGEIAEVGDADNDAKKQKLFERVRQGTVRVLIGSTQKMGTGANVQRMLVALHHLDAPWKPAEVEQREGRVLRQGNENEVVSIYRYVTEGSFDAFMWQALETKARFIAQVMTGQSGLRKAQDIGGSELSYAEVKAIASGNPAVLVLAEADAELQRLSTLKKHHADEQYLARRNVRELPEEIARLKTRLSQLAADMETARKDEGDQVVIGGTPCPRDKLISVLGARLDAIPDDVTETRRFTLGKVQGLTFGIVKHRYSAPDVFLEGQGLREAALSRDSQGPRAVLNAVERLIASYDDRCDGLRRDLSLAEAKLRDFQARLGATFSHARYIEELSALRDELQVALSTTTQQGGTARSKTRTTAELSDLIKGLRDGQVVEAPPAKRPAEATSTVRPVSARIRERVEVLPDGAEGNREVDARPRDEVPPVVPREEVTAPKPAAPRPVTRARHMHHERPRRYQKWLF